MLCVALHSRICQTPRLHRAPAYVTNLLRTDIEGYAGLIARSRGKAQFGNATGSTDQIDVQGFFQRMSDVAYKNGDSEIGLACDEVLEKLDGTEGGVVAAVQRNNNLENKLFGLGLIFPKHSHELASYYPRFDSAATGDPRRVVGLSQGVLVRPRQLG
jgi:hypothetical protein